MNNALIILDGFGKAIDPSRSAIDKANTPFIDKLLKEYPNTLISASGEDVGLPAGQMGNSEVGHLNIGAGRIVYQELLRIGNAIEDDTFKDVPELREAMSVARDKGKTLHIIGLLSDGGVHSHISHIFALVDLAKSMNMDRVIVHCFMDGRDVSPVSGAGHIQELEAHLSKTGVGKIGVIVGRYFAMDRDNRWDRVKNAYDALTLSEGENTSDPIALIKKRYDDGETDEFLQPIICSKSPIEDGDSVIFANFRPDRARQLTRAFTQPGFDGFEKKKSVSVHFVSMTQYDKSFVGINVAFKPQGLDNTFGEYISGLGLRQLRIAETEKYAHVTFFFNGGVEKANSGEDRELIASPKVATYDLKPEMSAYEVASAAADLVSDYDVMILNFANADMVGHTGDMNAAVKAVETVDACAKQVVEKILSLGGKCIITADHGNADIMMNDKGEPFTAHTTNLVPFVVVGCGNVTLKDGGRLCDVIPTLLDIMNIPLPTEMTGRSLISKN